MPDYRHRKKRAKKVKNDQKPSSKNDPIVNYDAINIEIGKIMKEKEKERNNVLKQMRASRKRKHDT